MEWSGLGGFGGLKGDSVGKGTYLVSSLKRSLLVRSLVVSGSSSRMILFSIEEFDFESSLRGEGDGAWMGIMPFSPALESLSPPDVMVFMLSSLTLGCLRYCK